MTKRRARRTVLILMLLIAPAFMNGCILTDLLGGLGGGGGLGALLGGAGGAGAAQPPGAAPTIVPNTANNLTNTTGSLPGRV